MTQQGLVEVPRLVPYVIDWKIAEGRKMTLQPGRACFGAVELDDLKVSAVGSARKTGK